MSLASDLACIMNDRSVTVSVAYGSPTQCARGHLTSEDYPELDTVGNAVMVKRRVLLLQEGALEDVESNATIVVDDVTYTIHGRPQSAGRGKVKLYLVEGT